ncbi:DedA family protein [Cellulomonas sp. Marseille-Q8402]
MTDTAAAYGMGGWPFWAVIAGLFAVVMARSHLFYWLGRGVLGGAARLADRTADSPGPADDAAAATGRRAHVVRLMRTPTARRGLAMVHRFGPFAVTLAYLTVGVQTAVFVGAGLVRMPYPRFTLASLPGAVAWAFVWGTVGLGAVWAGVRLATASPWGLGAVLLVLAALVAWVLLRRRAHRATPADQLV